MSRPPRRRLKNDPHIRLWANFFDECDEAGLSLTAQVMYLRLACRARQLHSDGRIHETQAAALRVPQWRKHVDALLAAGLLVESEGPGGRPGWYLPGYPNWNPCQADFERDRHLGRIGGCHSRHQQPCALPDCLESAAWLEAHPPDRPK